MEVGKVDIFTTTLNNETFTLPQGARTVDLDNTGAASGTFIGDSTKNGKDSSAVTIRAGQAYSFGDLGKPYPEIPIDATGTTIEISATY